MKPYDEQTELTTYVWNHYSRFCTPAESKANWAHISDTYARAGRTQFANFFRQDHKIDEDPAAMALLSDGTDVFRHRTAQRILRDHASEIFINRCPRCVRIVRTPKAQQCLSCGHDWHPLACLPELPIP